LVYLWCKKLLQPMVATLKLKVTLLRPVWGMSCKALGLLLGFQQAKFGLSQRIPATEKTKKGILKF